MDITVKEIQLIKAENGYINLFLAVEVVEAGRTIYQEFHIGRQVVGSRVVTRDTDGWYKSTDGNYYDPTNLPDPEPTWERETVVLDLKAEVLDVLKRTFRGMLDRGAKGDRVGVLKGQFTSFGNKRLLPRPVRDLEGITVVV